MQVVMVYFSLFSAFLVQFTLRMCIAAQNCAKFIKTNYFWGLKSFKVIDVGRPEKARHSACYDKQHICAYQ